MRPACVAEAWRGLPLLALSSGSCSITHSRNTLARRMSTCGSNHSSGGGPRFRAGVTGRRVAVTGLGLVTPVGSSVQSVWPALLAGKSGVAAFRTPEAYAGLPAQIAAEVKRGSQEGQFDEEKLLDAHSRRTLPDNIKYAIVAANEAVAMSGFKGTVPADMAGIAIGAGISGLQDVLANNAALKEKGLRRVSPYLIPNSLVNMAAGLIGIAHNLKGPTHAVSTACATGAHSIGDAFRLVSLGDADVMVCGGTDACIMPVVVAGFNRVHALATSFNDRPAHASRPFDAARDGFVIGEGAGVMVLEEYNHAVARGATIYAEIRGYGLTGDAHHITAPAEDGDGAVRCMRAALWQAGLAPQDVAYINAHATSTPLGDKIEATAIQTVFGDAVKNVSVSSTKGNTGHMLGAAGAAEAVITCLAMHHGVIPHTLNLETPGEGTTHLDHVMGAPRHRKIAAALSNSFGFGGTNACLAFTAPAERR
eukprot:m.162669 g.162669  ORF g.162669 m.162669 type:complete len:479 (+) comp17094_c0_seq3:1486-2922(+)